MQNQSEMTHQPVRSGSTGEEKIRLADRLVLFLFLLVFLGFGLILMGDLLSAPWR